MKIRRVVSMFCTAALLSSSLALAQYVQQGPKLVGSGSLSPARQGNSVALSADGNTAIVGGDFSDGGIGAAWVWTRAAGVWTQSAKLVGTDAVGYASQGDSVALSADGNTAIVGGQGDNNNAGAAWVWTRSGGAWTQQGPKLVGSGAEGFGARQGSSVSISADGNTAIVGGVTDRWYGNLGGWPVVGVGAAWVWTRSGGVWTQQGSKLVGSGANLYDFYGVGQGYTVALSADGNTALVGSNGEWDVWVWTRSGGVWSQQGPKISGVMYGFSVALSADGNTAALGGGAIWIRSGGVWSRQASYLGEGVFVSLSADGNTLILGDPLHAPGGAWVWTRSAGVWKRRGPKLVSTDGVGIADKGLALADGADFPAGNDVAISFDGGTVIVGGRDDNQEVGGAWIFTGRPGDTPQAPRARAIRH